MSIRGKTLAFTSKQRSRVLKKHFEIGGKTFAVQAKPVKVLALKHFVYTVLLHFRSSSLHMSQFRSVLVIALFYVSVQILQKSGDFRLAA